MPVRHAFHQLRLSEKHWITSDALLLRLQTPAALREVFRYKAGQHLPVRAFLADEDVRRTYSVCASESAQALDIAIRVQPGGRFSQYAARTLQPGDLLDVMPPSGGFQLVSAEQQRPRYAAFAAGSGITPILSILRTTLERDCDSHFTLFYGNRERTSTMFLETLLGLKNQYRTRLTLHFLLSREQPDTPLNAGRLDEIKTRQLLHAYFGDSAPAQCYVCGPGTLIAAVTTALEEHGVDANAIHYERFNTTAAPVSRRPPETVRPPPAGDAVSVDVLIDGHTRSFEMQRDGTSVLDAANANGLDLPYACKGGVCSTCRARVMQGQVAMKVNFALQPWETQAGYVLTCQSVPLSEKLVLDYDQV